MRDSTVVFGFSAPSSFFRLPRLVSLPPSFFLRSFFFLSALLVLLLLLPFVLSALLRSSVLLLLLLLLLLVLLVLLLLSVVLVFVSSDCLLLLLEERGAGWGLDAFFSVFLGSAPSFFFFVFFVTSADVPRDFSSCDTDGEAAGAGEGGVLAGLAGGPLRSIGAGVVGLEPSVAAFFS